MLFFGYFSLIYCILFFAIIAYGRAYASQSTDKKPLDEIIYVTASNLRGHKSLYKDGWFVVSSSEKAFNYAKKHSVTASKRAISRTIASSQTHTVKYGKHLLQAAKGGVRLGKNIYAGGTDLSKREIGFTKKLIKAEWHFSAETLKLAWQRFIKGNTSLGKRTAEDRAAIAAIPGRWYITVKSDFNKFRELTRIVKKNISLQVTGRWGEAFSEATNYFNEYYEKSGNCGNSISGLGFIFLGYGNAMYIGIIKPGARTIVRGAAIMVKVASKLVFLPLSLAVIVFGRTILSALLFLYYTISMAVELVSPTLEGGLLTGLSVLSYGAIPVTVVLGGLTVTVNQIVITVASPVAGAITIVFVSAIGTSVYAAQMSYTLIKGAAKITLNQAQSVTVLGYNALTALSTHLLLGSANVIVFLVYDVPRLAMASAKGEVQWPDKGRQKTQADRV